MIALFVALLANQMLKGYELRALSGFNQYDGLLNIFADLKELQDTANPLTLRNTDHDYAGKDRILEFKLHFASVLDDFEEKKKNPADISLLVCWTLPEMLVQRGRVEYTYGDRKDHRPLYGATHTWTDENETSSVAVMSLKHVVAELLKMKEGDEPALGAAAFEALLQGDKTASI